MSVGERIRGGWREHNEESRREGSTYDILSHLRRLWSLAMNRLLAPFIVSSSTNINIAFLDGLRGIAVIMVVLYHTWAFSGYPQVHIFIPATDIGVDLTPFLGDGATGVQLFFILSAFLLSQAWIKADYGQGTPVNIRRYFRHRLFRILPGYYCALFLMLFFFVPTIIPASAIYSHDGLRAVGIHLVFMQNLFPFTSSSWINGSLWTLTIEMMLYILLPWGVLLFLRNRWLVTLPVLAVVNVAWLWLWTLHIPFVEGVVRYEQHLVAAFNVPEAVIRYFIARQFPAHLVTFALGIVLANLYFRQQSHPAKSRIGRTLIGQRAGWAYFVLGWVILLWSMRETYIYTLGWFGWYMREISVSIGFILILAGLLWGGERLQARFSFAPLRLIGIIGFSAYLWHLPIITLLLRFPDIATRTPNDEFLTMLWRVSLAVLLMSVFFYLSVEKPFLLIGRRRTVVSEHSALALGPAPLRAGMVATPDDDRNGAGPIVAPLPAREPTEPMILRD